MNSPLSIIVSREYLERVQRKSFIISTLLTPLLMLGLMMAPALFAILAGPENKTIAVIDRTDAMIARQLDNEGELNFKVVQGELAELIDNADYDAVLVIEADAVSRPSAIKLYSHEAASMQTEGAISSQLENIIEDERIKAYDIDNLSQIMKEVKADVRLETFRISEGDTSETSSIISYIVGITTSLMLYMFIMLYGQMVMTSIIEEKNNRVLEIVVSSVKPNALMMGKIVGIGLVAVTQILIWGIILTACSIWLMPLVSGAAQGAGGFDLGVLGSPAYILELFGYITLFLIGGYLFYSSIYAAVGSAVDNIQDASQLVSIAVIPIIIGMVVSMSVVQNPASSLAVWTSMIPFTSPMVMMARIPFGIPAWQIWTSLALLYASFAGMVWLSAKIYRVGIFMYGKKPSFSELIRWARYK
ncbi:MAG: ABC transporter permease [Muribaculaceae bacterium]|jgi:ABC-2 type transport system permease protein|nr:ABC transporter permease [Muribaculaceae bacterium]